MKKKNTPRKRIAAKLKIPKEKEFDRNLKELANEMDQPRVAASARRQSAARRVATKVA